MTERKLPDLSYDSVTKNKILDEATRLFATKGFTAVSMKDIAEAIGIKPSSIYNHYVGKEALLEDVLLHFETQYRHYFEWLTSENAKADSLEQVMENMFKELIKIRDIQHSYYGISLAIMEQHHIESARKRTFELFYKDSIKLMQADFDRLVEKGIIPPSDTKIVATFLMFCVLIGNDIRIHESKGIETPINADEMYTSLKKFITSALKKGV